MLKNLKIEKKLIISFLIVSLLSALSGIVSVTLMTRADRQYSNALTNYGFSQGDIGLLMSALNENCTFIVTNIATDDKLILSQAEEGIQNNIQKINGYLQAVEKTIMTEEEQECYDLVIKNLPEFTEHAQKAMDLAKAGRNEEAMDLYIKEASEHIDIVKDATQRLMELNKNSGHSISTALTNQNHRLIFTMSTLIIIVLLISLFLAVTISRAIARPLSAVADRMAKLSMGDLHSALPVVNTKDETKMLTDSLELLISKLSNLIQEMTFVLGEMAEGNLNVSHNTHYNGDFGALHNSTVKIIDSFNLILSEMNEVANQVAGGSDQVSMGAQSLSQGATEQASAVEELAATLNEVMQKINQTASNTVAANEESKNVSSDLISANEQMQQLIQAMQEINHSSNEIGKIIKTIDDIAFQTNILALNAAVEAARAGEAGKGFAVVADEVRNLASKSAEAAKDTTELIENSIQAVETGSTMAKNTAESILKVVESAKKVSNIVEKISIDTTEEASSMNQITQGIDQISSVVQTNSATAEESAAASEELSTQSQAMKDMIAKFQIKK